MDKRKALKLEYKQNPPPMGVYQIKNNVNGKIFLGSSMNLPGSFNSHRFQLKQKVHRNAELQKDWDLYGANEFSFDILETLKTGKVPENNWREAVTAMEDKWLNKLHPYGESGYNKKKIERE